LDYEGFRTAMMRHRFLWFLAIAVLLAFVLLGTYFDRVHAAWQGGGQKIGEVTADSTLSPYWSSRIQQWSELITQEAMDNGLDPDFVAAVVEAESNGSQSVVSRVGAVGLMGIMPAGPGLEWRPTEEQLFKPNVNLSWGVGILGEIIRQSGGDISAALAAYSGGWDQVTSRVPRQYASQVLDLYGRAVAVRNGVSPEIASKWTVATELTRGHIPAEELILHDQPVSGLRKYGEHTVFHYTGENGYTYYVRGYAVPLALVVPLETNPRTSGSDSVDSQLMERLGVTETKISDSNPRVLLACLPSLSRLRGQLATRWFAPSSCPSWHP
jgi:hypothetical protein